MDPSLAYGAVRCDGCTFPAFELHTVDDAKLCGGCVEKSSRIDRRLATTEAHDPVFCDGCGDRVAFDACVAVVARELGGGVLCTTCKPSEIERGSA